MLVRIVIVIVLMAGGLYAIGRYATDAPAPRLAEAPHVPRLKPERDWRGVLGAFANALPQRWPSPRPDPTPLPSPASPAVVGRFSGPASYYAASLHGNLTASGEVYLHHEMTAAHKTLPFGTKLLVTRRDTQQVVMVTVNDRGPFVGNRVIDLSGAAAERLGMQNTGIVMVDVEVLAGALKVGDAR